MSGPPSAQDNRTKSGPAKGRDQRGRRDVIVQCDDCNVTGTARVAHGRVLSTTISGPTLHHQACGGRLRYFDHGSPL